MSSSLKRKADPQLRLVSDEEAVAVPEDARPSDDAPTVISKTPPIVAPISSTQDKIVDLARKSTPESIVMSLRGRRLAHFELIEPIGVGGMAAVIRARDTQLDRFVALKILPPEMSNEPDVVQRFHQEAKAAAKLDHENIARVFYCGEDQGLHFIAFEYVEGINLRTMLEKRGRLPVAEAIRYILQVATGLEHAATRGVVHRDVKPSNIIITPTGRAKLVDMGLARNLERKGQADLTQSGMTLGTFDYISPEQALEPRDADMRSDVYSLGCTLYHLLTGQPPVPEGTPAKKLHHHQHEAPIDPRQVDSSIPDDVVMILSKMMAKNPKDRYQRPIHLVHHLMQVARKVGAADDLPEGVMFVDTPLPGQPHTRPVLFIAAALLTLVAVTMLLSWLAPEPATNNAKGSVVPKKDTDDGKANGAGNSAAIGPISQPAGNPPADVKEAKDLENILAKSSGALARAVVKNPIDLGTTGLTYRGDTEQTLWVQGDLDDEEHARIRFVYKSGGSAVGLSIEGSGKVVFKRIRFEMDCDWTPDRSAAIVAIRGAKSVRFEQCIFAQPNVPKLKPATKKVPLASILVDADKKLDAAPDVSIVDCYFEGNSQGNGGIGTSHGQVAIAIDGPARVHVSNTAFRPHSAFFSLRDRCSLESTSLRLEQCAGLVTAGPAFRFAKDAAARVHAEKSAFCRPGKKEPSEAGLAQPGLIYLAGNHPITYEGRDNLYYALNDFIEYKGGLVAFGGDYAKLPDGTEISDDYAKVIGLNASLPSPLFLADPLRDPGVLAFQLKYDYAGSGLQRTWLAKEMPKAPAPAFAKGPKRLIVDPDDSRRQQSGEFKYLVQALSEAKNDDVIEIKHGAEREIEIGPNSLPRGLSVTLKAHEGFRPVLVLDKKALSEKDSFLFRLQEGRLQLEQLDFVLKPADQATSQSIVHLGDGASCVFKQCGLILHTGANIQLAAASFIDPERMMKMSDVPAPASGRLEFHECFIRGKGDLVSLRGCRPLQVDVKGSLIALDGSLLDLTALGPATEKMPEQGVRWNMERTSAFTTDSIFALRCNMPNAVLVRTEADIKNCLFASLKPERPIVLLDMADPELGKCLDWRGQDTNFYANFEKIHLAEWKNAFKEMKEFGTLHLPKLGDANRPPLWDAKLDWFDPEPAELERLQNFGHPRDLAAKLAPPAGDGESD